MTNQGDIMSAIAGIFNMNGEPVFIEHSNGMMKSLEKYPADDVQTWQDGNIFLGCHAQWITPESVGEKLPYYDHERKLAITADAIIDNRDELFDKLNIEKGKRQQMTDSELILLTYHKWGEDSPKHLVGDFAYMIWDEREQKLFGARDFSGSRTLYYYNDGKRMAFSTVIHPLLTLPYIKKELNEEWLAEFLAITDMVDAVNVFTTAYKNIEQVPPSHFISIKKARVKLERYHFFSFDEQLKLKSNEEYEEAFRDVLQKTVTARLRTHHNVGSQLSGGLDSGTVVSFAARALKEENKKLNTYSYIPEKGFIDWTPKCRLADERPYIKSTVQYVGNINDQYLSFNGKDPFSEIDNLLNVMEMPYKFFENSVWVNGIYEKAYADDVRVLLGGARGNFSISWGPALDYYAILLKKLRWFQLYRELLLYSKNVGVKKATVLSAIRRKAYQTKHHTTDDYQFPILINSNFANETEVYQKLQNSGLDEPFLNKLNIYEVRKNHYKHLYNWNTNGTSGTKLSLYYSAWNRDPTNDIRTIRFCLSIPDEQFVQYGNNRALIRRATKGYLPDKVRLNYTVRGIQGTDWVYRMTSSWEKLITELESLTTDNEISRYINLNTISEGLVKVKQGPQTDLAFDPDYRVLMRAVIVNRFLKQFI